MPTLSHLPQPAVFESFLMGGFECATHRRRDGARVDVIGKTWHDAQCATDYALLASVGIHTVRDGLRWHLIEHRPGVYDWSSFLPMLDAALRTGTQVIWDLCHWGVPTDLDPFSDDFAERFANFAAAAARILRDRASDIGPRRPTLFCSINEMSFWAWVGGDIEHFYPYGNGRGNEFKRCLVKASVRAIRAIREVDPQARFVQAEPIIHITADPLRPEDADFAARHTAAQFEVWDMLAGRAAPELGGAEDLLDVLGVNYYWNNQWIHEGDRTPPGHAQHRPLHLLLQELWLRYQRPIVITETGAEGEIAAGWLGYMFAEVRQALRLGVPVLGLCLYPVMDYPGWDDERHCACGLIASSANWTTRSLRPALLAEVAAQQELFRTFSAAAAPLPESRL